MSLHRSLCTAATITSVSGYKLTDSLGEQLVSLTMSSRSAAGFTTTLHLSPAEARALAAALNECADYAGGEA